MEEKIRKEDWGGRKDGNFRVGNIDGKMDVKKSMEE
jgi:hypothetical protein